MTNVYKGKSWKEVEQCGRGKELEWEREGDGEEEQELKRTDLLPKVLTLKSWNTNFFCMSLHFCELIK